MAKMYRIFYMLLILLWFRSSNGKCVGERGTGFIECDSMDEDVIDIAMREYGCDLYDLRIRDSNITHFQMPLACDYLPSTLAIRNSSLTSFTSGDDCSEDETIFSRLIELDLSFNEMRELCSLGTSIYLKKLVLRHNQINFLNGTLLAAYKNLFHLDLSHNRIENFTVIENKELTFLNLSHNLIENIGNLFSKSKIVQEVDLSYNKLRKISLNDFKDLKYVQYLNLSHNDIHTVDYAILIVQNPFWKYPDNIFYRRSEEEPMYEDDSSFRLDVFFGLLNLESNNLEDLKFMVNQMKGRKIRGNSLIFRKNIIKELIPSNFGGFILDGLDLSFNEIESMAPTTFEGLALKKLYLDHNKITHLNDTIFTPLSGLQLLNLSNNPLTTVGQTVFGVSYPNVVDFSHCLLTRVPPGNFKELSLDFNVIHQIEPNFSDNLTSLSIVSNPISVSSLLSFSQIIEWKRLNLTIDGILGNKSFFNLISMEELHIVNSNITQIKKYGFKGLSRLTKISFENSTVLEIEPGAFLGLVNVVDFDEQNLFDNIFTLKAETFVGLSRLKRLDFSRTGISNLKSEAFLGLESLRSLNLSHNKIKRLASNTFVGLKNLDILDLSNNLLSTFPVGIFRDLENLIQLHLEYNFILTFDFGSFSNLRSLQILNVSHSNIINIHRGYPLKNLRVLDMNFNDIKEFSNYLTDLQYYRVLKIGIGENSWTCNYLLDTLLKFDKYSINYTELSILNFEHKNIHGIRCS